MRWRGSGFSLPAESPSRWGKSQPRPRSLNFPQVQTSCRQSEQKYSNIQTVIHSMLVKVVTPLRSYLAWFMSLLGHFSAVSPFKGAINPLMLANDFVTIWRSCYTSSCQPNALATLPLGLIPTPFPSLSFSTLIHPFQSRLNIAHSFTVITAKLMLIFLLWSWQNHHPLTETEVWHWRPHF